MPDLMIDTEDFGTSHNALVRTIALVRFCPWEKAPTQPITHLDMRRTYDEQLMNGRVADASWWRTQSVDPFDQSSFMPTTLTETAEIIGAAGKEARRIWCRGGSFDFPIISTLLGKPPWDYWRERDARTLDEIIDCRTLPRDESGKHNALADCIAQIEHVQACYAIAKIGAPA